MTFLVQQTLIYAIPLMIVALSYLAMVIFLTYVLKGFERRLNKDKH